MHADDDQRAERARRRSRPASSPGCAGAACPSSAPAIRSKPESETSNAPPSRRAERRRARSRSARTHRGASARPRHRAARRAHTPRWRAAADTSRRARAEHEDRRHARALRRPTRTRLFPRYCGIGVARPSRNAGGAQCWVVDLVHHLDVRRFDRQIAVLVAPGRGDRQRARCARGRLKRNARRPRRDLILSSSVLAIA